MNEFWGKIWFGVKKNWFGGKTEIWGKKMKLGVKLDLGLKRISSEK